MDTKSLLDYFQALFVLEREEGGINVTAIAITPAYGDAVPNSFILGVSSPTLEGRGCSDKTDTIINLLYDKAGFEQRSMIDRVRVYESIDEIRRHSQAYFQPGLAMYCEMPVMDEERSRQLAVSE